MSYNIKCRLVIRMNNYYSPPSAPPLINQYDVPLEIINDVNTGRTELIRQGLGKNL